MVGTKTLIGYVTSEYARRADFYDYVNIMIKPEGTLILPCHDRSPAQGRNIIIQQAIEEKCTHVLLMDDDMVMEKNALIQLLEDNVDIVTGLYLSRAYPHQPLVFDVAASDGSCLPMYLEGNEPKLVEVKAAGLGFCLIKMDVFNKLEKPWIRLGELDNQEWCDDMGFFKRVREAGIKIHCDTECMLGHIGTMIIRINKQNGTWFTGYDTNGRDVLNTPQIYPTVKYGEK